MWFHLVEVFAWSRDAEQRVVRSAHRTQKAAERAREAHLRRVEARHGAQARVELKIEKSGNRQPVGSSRMVGRF